MGNVSSDSFELWLELESMRDRLQTLAEELDCGGRFDLFKPLQSAAYSLAEALKVLDEKPI